MMRTSQSSSAAACGTSRPASTDGGHGCESNLSMTGMIECMRTSTGHDMFDTVSYRITSPRWHLRTQRWTTACTGAGNGATHRLSRAYPPSAQLESTPLQVPIGIGSAVWKTCVMCCVESWRPAG